MRLVLTGYFSLMGATSLVVMLLAMSFNVGIITAILVGEVRGGWVGWMGWKVEAEGSWLALTHIYPTGCFFAPTHHMRVDEWHTGGRTPLFCDEHHPQPHR